LDDLGAAYHRSALAEIHGSSDGVGEKRREGEDDDDEEEQGESDSNEEHERQPGFEDVTVLTDGATLLEEYIQRLNPGVHVDVVPRSELVHLLKNDAEEEGEEGEGSEEDGEEEGDNHVVVSLGTNPVMVCVDRSLTYQLKMNDACRHHHRDGGQAGTVPFVSIETAGVHAKLFCDFGAKFVVVDEDGETPRSTLLDRVEKEQDDNNDDGNDEDEDESAQTLYTVHCLEGERHDVSKGDVIEFQGEHVDDEGASSKASFPKCQVTSVKSPTCFMVQTWENGEPVAAGSSSSSSSSSSSLNSLLEGKARSFSRVKVPKQISFSSLGDILQNAPSSSSEEERVSATAAAAATTVNYDDALFAPSDLDKSFDPLRRRAVMTSMAALDAFVHKYGRLPSRYPPKKSSSSKHHKRTDMERFHSLVQKMSNTEDDTTSDNQKERWEVLVSQFAQTCRAKFTPVQALAGALGAQEVLKAATGLYNPVRQFLLYDCDEVLHQPEHHDSEEVRSSSMGEDTAAKSEVAAPGQTYILGEETSKKIENSRLFLVGAGAIGCELLKNLAAMGAGTGVEESKKSKKQKGCLILTDMDTIEKSNLSRQLLFRDHDVGEFKSVAARDAMRRFSPHCRIETHTSRVGEEESDGPFNDDFWASGCDVVLNALDNVEARLFVDSQCVAHALGLIDAGTLGPKGNVQVVIPHESESYGSSADPPEPDIPVCTLKNFPYEISHTIQWARDLFDGYFNRRPRQANDHVEEMMAETSEELDLMAFGQGLLEKLGEDAALDMAAELGEDLGVFPFIVGNADASDPEYVAAVKKVSLQWAIREANKLFFMAMDELLQKHPVDSVDDDGAPFWSGTRKVPRPLRFIPLDSEDDEVSAQQMIINERIAQFVQSAARLRMESFLLVDNESDNNDESPSSISLDEALFSLEEHAKLLYKKKKSTEILHNLSGGGSSDGSDDDTLSLMLDKLNGAKTGASFLPRLNLADFEKDDESNGHVAFVTAASNLRAMAYGIPPADAMETRRVAGRIVPAMITTTGLVSALSCLELVKLLKGLPLGMYRNAFVNLALPFFAFTAPMPAEEVEGINGKTHTIWDRIIIKGSNKAPTQSMTLGKFLKKIEKKVSCGENVEVASISYGPFMIYANFLHGGDEEILEASLLETVREAVVSVDDDDDDMLLFGDEDVEEDKETPVAVLTNEQKAMLSNLDQKIFIDFSVTVEDQETGEEFELPPVRLIKHKERTRDKTDVESQ